MRTNLCAFTLYKAGSVPRGTAGGGTHRCRKRIYALFADFHVDSSCWTDFLLDEDTNNQRDADYRLDYGGYGVAP
jgi:hypothetical protein